MTLKPIHYSIISVVSNAFAFSIFFLISTALLLPTEAFAQFQLKDPKAALVAESVVEINGQIITRRDIEIHYYIDKILFNNVKKYDPKTAASDFILDYVVYLEAKNFNLSDSVNSDLLKLQEKMETEWLATTTAQGLSVQKEELRKKIEQKWQAKNFLEFKTKSLVTSVSEEEARDYFTKNRSKFGNVPFEDLKSNIQSFLEQNQLKERLTNWFMVIQRKYKVRYLLL